MSKELDENLDDTKHSHLDVETVHSELSNQSVLKDEGEGEDGRAEDAENAQHSEDEEKAKEDEDNAEDEVEKEPTPDLPYIPPPQNFIRIEFGDSSTPFIVNIHCKKKIFVDFINSKMNLDVGMDELELCDTVGDLVGLRSFASTDLVDVLFEPAHTYIPIEFTDSVFIYILLDNIFLKYPNMEPKLSMEKLNTAVQGICDVLNLHHKEQTTAMHLNLIPLQPRAFRN